MPVLEPTPPLCRIVVLAGDEAVRDVLVHWLETSGHRAHGFGDGGSAARWLDREGADILVTDRAYPAWNGLGTIQAIKHRFPHMRVVVAGISRDDRFQSLARAIGADSVVYAPLRRAAVMDAVTS